MVCKHTNINDLISKYPIICCLSLRLNTGILENPEFQRLSNVPLSSRVESEIMKTFFILIIESLTCNFANLRIPVMILISYMLRPSSDCSDSREGKEFMLGEFLRVSFVLIELWWLSRRRLLLLVSFLLLRSEFCKYTSAPNSSLDITEVSSSTPKT